MEPVKQSWWLSQSEQVRMAIFLIGVLLVIYCGAYIKSLVYPVIIPTAPQILENVLEPINTTDQEIVRGDTTKKQVIFTFDAGSIDVSTEKILSVLAKHHVKGTFFMTGKFVTDHPDLVKKVISEGHEIFNHTYNHPHLPELINDDIVSELSQMNSALLKVANISSKPFFRPPYGDRDERVLAAAYEAGYRSVYWTIDVQDWMLDTTLEKVRARILDNVAPGTIYLMHVGDTFTGDVLDDVFTTIEERGYKLVSLTQGL